MELSLFAAVTPSCSTACACLQPYDIALKVLVAPSETAAVDRGYVGARSAALMKRSANTQRRRERAVEERRGLLHNVERVGELRLTVLRHPKETLVRVEEGVVCLLYTSRCV